MLVLTALTRAVGLAPTPSNWTLAHFHEALAGANLAAFGRSLLLSGTAATLVVVLGSLVTSLRRTRCGRPLRSAVLVTFAVPGSTLAVAVLLAYGATLRDTLLIILIAYLSKLWGLGHRVVEGAADAVAPDFYLAARASGASAPTALATVLGPIMSPALLASWLLVFVFAFHELTMSSLLYGPGTSTLAVVVLNLQQLGDVSTTAALSVLLTVPVVMVAVPMVILSRRSRLRAGD
jgi:iron(III) transport system permease protein